MELWTWARFNLWYGPLSVKTEQFMETLGHKLFMKWILNQFRLFDSEGMAYYNSHRKRLNNLSEKIERDFPHFQWLFPLIAFLSGWILTKTDCRCLVSVSITHWVNFEQHWGILTIKFWCGLSFFLWILYFHCCCFQQRTNGFQKHNHVILTRHIWPRVLPNTF